MVLQSPATIHYYYYYYYYHYYYYYYYPTPKSLITGTPDPRNFADPKDLARL